jgi:hypothetical protein
LKNTINFALTNLYVGTFGTVQDTTREVRMAMSDGTDICFGGDDDGDTTAFISAAASSNSFLTCACFFLNEDGRIYLTI